MPGTQNGRGLRRLRDTVVVIGAVAELDLEVLQTCVSGGVRSHPGPERRLNDQPLRTRVMVVHWRERSGLTARSDARRYICASVIPSVSRRKAVTDSEIRTLASTLPVTGVHVL